MEDKAAQTETSANGDIGVTIVIAIRGFILFQAFKRWQAKRCHPRRVRCWVESSAPGLIQGRA